MSRLVGYIQNKKNIIDVRRKAQAKKDGEAKCGNEWRSKVATLITSVGRMKTTALPVHQHDCLLLLRTAKF